MRLGSLIVVAAGLLIAACGGVSGERAEISPGEKAYRSSCGTCHSLKKPDSRTVVEWGEILEKHKGRARLSDSTLAIIGDYLTSGRPDSPKISSNN